MEKTLHRTVDMDYSNIISSHSDSFEFFNYVVAILCTIIIVVNLSVVVSIGILLKRRQEPRATFKFLGNISCADMLLGISKLFVTLCPYQLHSEFLCSFSSCVSTAASMTSIFSIGLIAIDRYLYIVYGLHYHRYITNQRSNFMILSSWLVSIVLGTLVAHFLRSPMNEKYCWLMVLVAPKIALILPSLGVIPLIIILVLYSIILKNALNSRYRMNCSTICSLGNHDGDLRMFRGREQITSNCADENLHSKIRSFGLPCCRKRTLQITPNFCENKWKAVKMVVITTGAYFIIWFTYFVTYTFYAFSDDNCESLAYMIGRPMAMLGLINSLLNPIIYAWLHPGFRKSVVKMYSMMNVKVCSKKSASFCPKQKIRQRCSIKHIGEDKLDNKQGIY